MNVVVIVVDTLRYDHVAFHGANDVVQTPNMDRLAEGAWVFDNSYTASYPTIPHRTDAITGKYGAPFFPWRPLRHDHVTLPWNLSEAGYCTQLIHDTPHLVNGGHNFDWPFHGWTQERGAEVDRPWVDDSQEWLDNWARDPLFDAIDADPMKSPMVAAYARANRKRKAPEDWNCAKLFLTASEWLKDNTSRDRALLWLDCFDPHEPWDAPPDLMRMYDDTPGYDGTLDPRAFVGRNQKDLSEAARARIKARYVAKTSWVDRWLGVFLDTLESTGMAEKTAVLLTADHGTNLGERWSFGKGAPVREYEAHTPFIVSVPGRSGSRSDLIVQPQDIFATVCGLAGVGVPEGIESHDVVAAAEAGEAPRELALSAAAADQRWNKGPETWLFSAFDGEWHLELTPKPETSRLHAMGSVEDVAADHAEVVQRLHARALDEVERRGIDPSLMAWLRSGGEADFPEDATFWDGYPGPAEFRPYFSRTYVEPDA